MSNRVDATITFGGPLPADRLEELLCLIEAERLGPDWEVRFSSRQDLLSYLEAGAEGVALYAHEVAGGEFDDLMAFCVEVGLAYVLTCDGYGGEWGPVRRIRRPGDTGDGVTCSLNADGGYPCVSADDIRHLGLSDLDAVLAFLEQFNDPRIPPFTLEPGG